ncbi:unnamed protein product [Calypogeia fissa]
MEGRTAAKEGSITVTVKSGTQTLPITLPSTASVKDLMLQIKQLTNVLPRGQKLIYKGKLLDPDATLAGAKVVNGAKLMLMASDGVHQGGPPPPSTKTAKSVLQGKLKNVLGALHVPKMGKSIEKGRVGAWQATGIVSLRDGHLQTVPKEVWALGPAVRIMDLCGNSLRSIPGEISALLNLQRLRLSSNSLTENEINWKSLAALKSLSNLALDHNRLKAVPKEIGKLTSLKLLTLAHNQIETIPEEIGNLAQLEKLDVSHNKLTTIPSTFGQCTQLTDVNFSANHLSAVPSSLSSLVSLKVLVLDNNALEKIPGEILSGCLELNTLSLHGNQITIDKLRETEGWADFDKRRKSKYSKQLDFNVIGSSSGFDEGADAQQWTNW